MVRQKYFREGAKCTKYNEINNTSGNFRKGKIAARRWASPPYPHPPSCGPGIT